MAKAQAAFKKMGGKGMTKGVNGDFFLMLHSLTTIFMAFWVPPMFIWVVARWMVFMEPLALGKRNVG